MKDQKTAFCRAARGLGVIRSKYMVDSKKIGVVAVVAVFTFAVISPVCCAQDWSDLIGHAHKTPDHSRQHDDTSECNVPLLKTMAKPDMIYASHNPPVTSNNITFKKDF